MLSEFERRIASYSIFTASSSAPVPRITRNQTSEVSAVNVAAVKFRSSSVVFLWGRTGLTLPSASFHGKYK